MSHVASSLLWGWPQRVGEAARYEKGLVRLHQGGGEEEEEEDAHSKSGEERDCGGSRAETGKRMPISRVT